MTARRQNVQLYSTEGFELLSDLWLKVGWNQKHSYTFTWMGVPVVQLPEDMIRVQELIHRLQPEVILECGVAHGGGRSSTPRCCKAIGKGRVIGVDIEIRPHNRAAIEGHPLFELITLIEGSSTDPDIVPQVKAEIGDRQERPRAAGLQPPARPRRGRARGLLRPRPARATSSRWTAS